MRLKAVEEIIRKAIEEGAFENLPGEGQPLKLDENPYVDAEWQLAYHLLKQNNFAPDWVEARQEIEEGLALAREILARSRNWREAALARGEDSAWVEAEWGKAQARFREAVEKINKQIENYNLVIPSDKLYRRKVDVEGEISKMMYSGTR